jgi:hypothetical protein
MDGRMIYIIIYERKKQVALSICSFMMKVDERWYSTSAGMNTYSHAWHPTFDTHTCRMRPLLSEWGHGTGHLSGKCIFSMKWTSSALCPSEQICSLNVEEQSSTPCNVSAWGGRKAGRFTTQMAPRGYHKPPTISPGLIFFRKRFLMGLYNNNNNNNNLFPAYLQSIAIHLDPKLY